MIEEKTCPYCNMPCAKCPHFSLESVEAWILSERLYNKSSAMAFDVLLHEIKGTIKIHRVADWRNTFMGIEHFTVVDREAFNAGIVPEWTGIDGRLPECKTAIESWRTLGWTCTKTKNDTILFAFDIAIRRQKRATRSGEPMPLKRAAIDRALKIEGVERFRKCARTK